MESFLFRTPLKAKIRPPRRRPCEGGAKEIASVAANCIACGPKNNLLTSITPFATAFFTLMCPKKFDSINDCIGRIRVRRPQKPFTVEVKRGRTGTNSKSTGAARPRIGIVIVEEAASRLSHRAEAVQEREPAPKRRILEAILPASAPMLMEAESEGPKTDALVAEMTIRKPRGRSAKVAKGVALGDVPLPRASKIAEPVADVVLFAAQRPAAEPRLSQNSRVGTAAGLRRGERWKRRLPKVLW